jgi:hypothetical protein
MQKTQNMHTGTRFAENMSQIECIILDIDNTLVHAVNPRLVDPLWLTKFETRNSKDYCIFLRPGLHKFLDYIFSKYKVGVFSAGDSEYVNFVANNIIANSSRKIEFVLSNKDFEVCKYETGDLKSISWVNQKYPKFSINNTLIIDDYFLVKASNPKNTILVDKFEICSEVKSNIEIQCILNADNKIELLSKLYKKECETDTVLSHLTLQL